MVFPEAVRFRSGVSALLTTTPFPPLMPGEATVVWPTMTLLFTVAVMVA